MKEDKRKEYLIQWSNPSNGAMFTYNKTEALRVARYRVGRWGGMLEVSIVGTMRVIYRVFYDKEDKDSIAA